MRCILGGGPILLGLTGEGSALPAVAQQATVAVPYRAATDGFYENMSLRWGLSGPGWFFRFGGGPGVSYGGFDPSAGAAFGYGFHRPGLNGYFYGNLSQGSRGSLISQTPTLSLSNGLSGYFADISWSPFVIGTVPVVGGFPLVEVLNPPPVVPVDSLLRYPMADPMSALPPKQTTAQPVVRPKNKSQDNLVLEPDGRDEPGAKVDQDPRLRLAVAGESTAGRPAVSVEAARQVREREQTEAAQEAAAYVERGRQAEAVGKLNVARQYYQMAYRRATAPQREEIRMRLASLPAPTNPEP